MEGIAVNTIPSIDYLRGFAPTSPVDHLLLLFDLREFVTLSWGCGDRIEIIARPSLRIFGIPARVKTLRIPQFPQDYTNKEDVRWTSFLFCILLQFFADKI